MPITYVISSSEGHVVETWLGDVSAADLREHWSVLLQDHKALELRKTLADLRDATLVVSDQELRLAVKELAEPLLAGRNWITAIVVRTLAQFRLSTYYQGVAMAYSRDVIMSDPKEARRWLLKQQPVG